MQILHFIEGEPPTALTVLDTLPKHGLVWVDLVRDETKDWATHLETLLRVEIDPEHVNDSLSPTHPSFFDGTADYDMLIFEGLGPDSNPFPLQTRRAALFLFDRALVTIHSADSLGVINIRQRLLNGRARCRPEPVQLAHLILDGMVDRFLTIREALDERLTRLQDQLLNPGDGVEDWRPLLEGRRVARRLERLADQQLEALDAWRRGTRFERSAAEEVRMRDLEEHVRRVMDHASNVERDVEAAVQLHFASVTHRTNKIVQTLTVISAIFFPLTLITGVYGMNFDHMPELGWRYGYFALLGLLLLVTVALLLLFRRRGYL